MRKCGQRSLIPAVRERSEINSSYHKHIKLLSTWRRYRRLWGVKIEAVKRGKDPGGWRRWGNGYGGLLKDASKEGKGDWV